MVQGTTCCLILLLCVNSSRSVEAWNGASGPYWYQPFAPVSGGHKVNFSWSIRHDHSTRNQYLRGTFEHTVPAGHYVGIGLKSKQDMDGLLIICDQNEGSTSGAFCLDNMGTGYKPQNWPGGSETTVVSSSVMNAANGTALNTLTFERIIVKKGVDLGVAAIGAWYRTIFAWGPIEKGKPKQHEGFAIAGASIDFATGSVQVVPGSPHTYFVVFWLTTAVFGIVVRTALWTQVGFHHWVRIVAAVGFGFFYFILFILHTDAARLRYYQVSSLGPFVRALGDGATFVFMGLLLTVSRRFFFSEVFHVSHERAIKFHATLGVFLVILIVWHAVGMSNMYGTSFVFRWSNESPPAQPVFAGVLAETCLMVCVFFALLRFDVSYKAFRLTHYAWIPAVLFTCLHSHQAFLYLAPGLILLVANVAYGRVVNWSALVKSATYHRDAGVFVVEVERVFMAGISPSGCHPDTKGLIGVGPAQWCYVSFPEVSRWQLHPFSISRADVRTQADGTTVQTLRFAIKATYGQGGGGSIVRPYLEKLYILAGIKKRIDTFKEGQSWTTAVCKHYGGDAAQGEKKVYTPSVAAEGNEGSLLTKSRNEGYGSDRKGEHGKRDVVPATHTVTLPIPIVIEGAFGSVQLPLHKYRNIILVSGGIGVTPNLLIFQHLAVMAAAGQKKWDNIVWIWVNRDDSLMPLFQEDIKEYAARALDHGVSVSLRNFVTSKSGKTEPYDGEMGIVRGSRPDFDAEILAVSEASKAPASQQRGISSTAMYCCGPVPMLESASNAATSSPDKLGGFEVHVHTEVFNV